MPHGMGRIAVFKEHIWMFLFCNGYILFLYAFNAGYGHLFMRLTRKYMLIRIYFNMPMYNIFLNGAC